MSAARPNPRCVAAADAAIAAAAESVGLRIIDHLAQDNARLIQGRSPPASTRIPLKRIIGQHHLGVLASRGAPLDVSIEAALESRDRTVITHP